MTSNCDICVETVKKLIICNQCQFESCVKCTKRYFTTSKSVKCMNCFVVFDRTFIYNNFNKSFLTKEYKNLNEDIIYERELGFMQGTHQIIENRKRLSILEQERNISNAIRRYCDKMNSIPDKSLIPCVLNFKTHETLQKYFEHVVQINREYDLLINDLTIKNVNGAVKSEFITKCTTGECKGLVSIRNHECNVCSSHYCKKCLEVKHQEHTCNEDTLITINFLKKDSKNCPSCQTTIYKIDGCNQMFCVSCHTAFDWKTLRIEHDRIHNPHYFEYIRANGNTPQQTQHDICFTEINTNFINFLNMKRFPLKMHIKILEICRQIMHLRYTQQNNQEINTFNINLENRILLINNKLSEKEFKVIIQRKVKKMEQQKDFNNIINLCVLGGTEIMLKARRNNDKNFYPLEEIKDLSVYLNKLIDNHNKIYLSTSKKRFTKNLELQVL